MNYKRYVSLVLAIALLVVPVTYFYPLSWQEIKEKASTLQNFVPLAFMIGAAGLMYYFGNKIISKSERWAPSFYLTVISRRDSIASKSWISSSNTLFHIEPSCYGILILPNDDLNSEPLLTVWHVLKSWFSH